MTLQQFEMIDGFFNGTWREGKRELADMSEEELEAELKALIQLMRPARGAPFQKADFTVFNQIHGELAQIFDPTGEHARAMDASGQRRSSRSRRLSYLSLIQK